MRQTKVILSHILARAHVFGEEKSKESQEEEEEKEEGGGEVQKSGMSLPCNHM